MRELAGMIRINGVTGLVYGNENSLLFGIGAASGSLLFAVLFGGESPV